MWAGLGMAGLLVVVTGWLPRPAAYDVAVERGLPVLGFLVAITVLAELADRAGVFDAAAGVCARASPGSTWGLFGLIAALGTVITIGMSLDTTGRPRGPAGRRRAVSDLEPRPYRAVPVAVRVAVGRGGPV